MKKFISISILIYLFISPLRAQQSVPVFDTANFNHKLVFADWLVEYEYFTQLLTDSINKLPEIMQVSIPALLYDLLL